MHLLVRRGGSVKPPCKTLPGLAQLFVSKTCSSRRALCTEFTVPFYPLGYLQVCLQFLWGSNSRCLCRSGFPLLPWAVADPSAVGGAERALCARSASRWRRGITAAVGGDCPLPSAASEATPGAVSSWGSSAHGDVSSVRSSSVWSQFWSVWCTSLL